MARTISITNTFASQSGSIPLSQLDTNFTDVQNYINSTTNAIVLTTETQTITNKTFTSPNHTTQVLASAASVTWNISAGDVAIITLNASPTFATPTNMVVGSAMLIVSQDTATRTITWASSFKWQSAAPPTLSAGGSKKDLISFFCDGTSMYGISAIDMR